MSSGSNRMPDSRRPDVDSGEETETSADIRAYHQHGQDDDDYECAGPPELRCVTFHRTDAKSIFAVIGSL